MLEEKRFQKSLEFLIAATRGGYNRGRIIHALLEKPLNPNQLSKQLNLDYKTVIHHLEKLRKDNIVVEKSSQYGGGFSLAFDGQKKQLFNELWQKIGKSNKNPERSE